MTSAGSGSGDYHAGGGEVRGEDVLAFFKLIDSQVPRSLDIHVVLDNLSAHTNPQVTTWLAHPRRARWRLYFTPTSSSWLNLVERWFKHLPDRRLRRGIFTSVPALIDAIMSWRSVRRCP
jgi:transposase